MPNSIGSLLLRLWLRLPYARKNQLIILIVLNVVSSILEIISIGSVLPFMAALLDPQRVLQYPLVGDVLSAANINTDAQIVWTLTLFFCFAAGVAGGVRLGIMWWQTRLSYEIGAEFAAAIYLRALHRSYADHLKISSSETISAVSDKVEIIVRQTLFPILTIASSMIMAGAILVLLFLANPGITIISAACFGLTYLAVIGLSKGRLSAASSVIDLQTGKLIKAMQEGLGSIRDIIIDRNQSAHIDIYLAADKPLRRARANVLIISQAPRYVIEAAGLIFIGFMASYLSTQGNLVDSLPALGVLALGVQRLLPVLQHAYAGWACVRGSQEPLETALDLLDESLPQVGVAAHAMSFRDQIELDRIHYSFAPDQPDVLKDVSFAIPKGSKVGIVGETGSGKSTLLDVFMGLFTPTQGEMRVDGVAINFDEPGSWHALISHVPQNIFISDSSVAENIAFGVPTAEIDRQRVEACARQAQLLDFIERLPQGFNTIVGERGAWLSGGQRQRIGIARALYKSAQVIVLDEATSALDSNTEASIMEAIDGLGPEITVVMVAHRISTLRACEQIVELSGGTIKRISTYADFADVK